MIVYRHVSNKTLKQHQNQQISPFLVDVKQELLGKKIIPIGNVNNFALRN